ncbi:MAG: hypothetical protein ABL963_07460 [Longimicrobiales bacterium]
MRVRISHTLNALDPRPKTRHFIHIPKNGGMAVRLALALKGVALERPLHSRYVDLEPKTGRRYFCVVRNPWSRTASRYLYTKRNAAEWPDTDPRRQYIESVTFEQYIDDRRVFPIPGQVDRAWPLSLWIDQLDWITDRKGSVAGDCLRLEELDGDLSAYFGRHINVQRASLFRTGPYNYRSMYSARAIQAVADAFARDIDHFGFDFDRGATRNTYALS